jgi:hypothetical protein
MRPEGISSTNFSLHSKLLMLFLVVHESVETPAGVSGWNPFSLSLKICPPISKQVN